MPNPTSPLIQARSLSRVYHAGSTEVIALRNVDLDVRKGELVAVMGSSGSGKTTLLNCLSGLDQVTSGEVMIEGTSLAKMTDGDRSKYRSRRMGFVFQAFNLLPVFSAIENVELPMLLAGERSGNARRKATESLELVGLAERARHKPAELSGGEQQRVAIARAIASNPAVVWADEPTGNLDSDNAAKIIDLLVRLNLEHGLTVVMVTHDPAVGSRTGRIIRMIDGMVVDEDKQQQATQTASR